jgi:hypothetical protein
VLLLLTCVCWWSTVGGEMWFDHSIVDGAPWKICSSLGIVIPFLLVQKKRLI